jgi:hypothetical protein
MSESLIKIIEVYFYWISSIVLTIIGLIGNTIVIFILSRKKFLKVSLFRYLVIATVTDTLSFLFIWPANTPEMFGMNKYAIICKLYQYLSYIVYQLSVWIIVLSSLDRFLAVIYSNRFKVRNKFNYQAGAILIILTALFLVDIPFLLFYDIYEDGNQTFCGYNPSLISFGFYMDLLNSFISVFIPIVVMMSTTIIIGHHLIKNKIKLQKNRKNFDKEKQLVKTLCGINIFYLACTLPFCILTVTYDALGINYFGTLEFSIVNFLTYVYSSCDFFIYLSCNKLFRQYFFYIISCGRKPIVSVREAQNQT